MRQFILEKNPDKKGIIVLGGKDYRYLHQVLRVRAGDMVSVRLPDGSLKNSTVAKIDDNQRKITLQLCADTGLDIDSKDSSSGTPTTRGVQASEIEHSVEAGVEYWLMQFIPKPQKLEQIVRQATECGVKRIVPVIGEYSEKSSVNILQGAKKERISRIIKEARQQSGSPVDTVVEEPLTLEKAVDLWRQAGNDSAEDEAVGFVLSERNDGDGNIRKILAGKKEIKRICIVCGCEGGISPQEVDFLVKKGLFYPIHFSVNILRCETAALYGIAAVQSTFSIKDDV